MLEPAQSDFSGRVRLRKRSDKRIQRLRRIVSSCHQTFDRLTGKWGCGKKKPSQTDFSDSEQNIVYLSNGLLSSTNSVRETTKTYPLPGHR